MTGSTARQPALQNRYCHSHMSPLLDKLIQRHHFIHLPLFAAPSTSGPASPATPTAAAASAAAPAATSTASYCCWRLSLPLCRSACPVPETNWTAFEAHILPQIALNVPAAKHQQCRVAALVSVERPLACHAHRRNMSTSTTAMHKQQLLVQNKRPARPLLQAASNAVALAQHNKFIRTDASPCST
jgi:hypothetical protein